MDIWVLKKSRLGCADLKEMIHAILIGILPDVEYRCNETIHSYTVNGLEVEIKTDNGWMEILECGEAHPWLLNDHNLPSQEWSGLAMGIGIDRLVMLIKELDDIRLLRSDNPKISEQINDLEKYKPGVFIPFPSVNRKLFRINSYVRILATKGRVVNLNNSKDASLRLECDRIRYVWNHFLAANIKKYEEEKKFIFYNEMCLLLTKLRKENDFVRAGGATPQQQALKALDRAIKESGKNKKGFPKFKSRHKQQGAIKVPAKNCKVVIKGKYITHVGFPKQQLLRVRNLKIPEGGKRGTATLKQDATGWTVSIIYEKDIEPLLPTNNSIGIDLGLTDFAVMSNGDRIANPRHMRKASKRLAKAQRAMARKKKGSNNRRKARKKVAVIHRRIARLRNNFHHQLTRELVNKYQYISVEDLCVKGLARTRMAKSVYDVGWGDFLRQLEYKAEWAGRTFTKYPRFKRSTGVCPDCGHVGDKLPLSVREWTCGECGVVHDRDIAAAKIIEVGAVCPEPKEISPSKCSHIGDMELSVVGRDDFNKSRPPEPEQIDLPHLRMGKG